jgi:hypothetical protein
VAAPFMLAMPLHQPQAFECHLLYFLHDGTRSFGV